MPDPDPAVLQAVAGFHRRTKQVQEFHKTKFGDQPLCLKATI